MSVTKIEINDLLLLRSRLCVIDVRSEGEFNHAHIPGAVSLPIFNDEERKIIGTAYKQESREKAIRIGLDFFGKKLLALVDAAELLSKSLNRGHRELVVHCWRGGMRSATMAWLLDLYGYKVYLLNGGYKNYRHWVLQQLALPYPLHVIAGYTGSNKTGVLQVLKEQEQNVIDLEALAKHKGSTFGNLNEHEQPSQEYFENTLADALFNMRKDKKIIWIEGESQRIGKINIPKAFYLGMLAAPSTVLQIPFAARLKHIMHEYGEYDTDKLAAAIVRITKKLGGLETKNALLHLTQNELADCFAIILQYYDRLYHRSTFSGKTNAASVTEIQMATTDAITNAKILLANDNIRKQL